MQVTFIFLSCHSKGQNPHGSPLSAACSQHGSVRAHFLARDVFLPTDEVRGLLSASAAAITQMDHEDNPTWIKQACSSFQLWIGCRNTEGFSPFVAKEHSESRRAGDGLEAACGVPTAQAGVAMVCRSWAPSGAGCDEHALIINSCITLDVYESWGGCSAQKGDHLLCRG